MPLNHRKAYIQLVTQHERERELLANAGVCNEKIDLLFSSDFKRLNRDRAFYNHIDPYVEPDDETFVENAKQDSRFDWLEQIENLKLIEALQNLSDFEVEILRLHLDEQLPLTFVAAFLDKPYEQIKKRYYRAVEKLKKYF